MNSTQIKSLLTPLIGLLVAWLSRKVPFIDAATWSSLIDTVIAMVVAGVVGFFNRSLALKDTVGNMPQTVVVTTPQDAAALPDNKDVIASTPQVNAAVAAAR